MSEEALRHYGEKDELIADLYAIKQFLLESDLEPKVYYLERVEGGFVRPSFLIQVLNFKNIPKNQYMSWVEADIQIQFFSDDMFEAQYVASRLMQMLAPVSDVLLPHYDFTVEPPQPVSITGIGPDGTSEPAELGL